MKLTSFSKTHFIIFTSLSLFLLLAEPALAKRKNKIQRQETKKVLSFQDDQCFCGVRYDKTKKLNLDLFGSQVAAQILNYVDQSISKFNALNMVSELAVAPSTSTTKNPYFGAKNSEWAQKQKAQIQKKTQGNNLESLRITLIKTVEFQMDNKNNKIMRLEFMMGRKIAFHIEIKLLDFAKKQFDIRLNQVAYVPGNSAATRELQKKFKGFNLSRSLSHFDKNQLEVDVCRMMYTALNQLSIREFKTSISEQIVRYGKTRMTENIAQGCKRRVLFRQRFSNEYMAGIVQTYYSKVDKKQHQVFRAKLVVEKKNDFHEVNQDIVDGSDLGLTRQVSKSQIEDFNDQSEEDREASESSSMINESKSTNLQLQGDKSHDSEPAYTRQDDLRKQNSPQNTVLERQDNMKLSPKQIDQDQDSSSSQSSNSSHSKRSGASIKEDQEYYNLRNRQVPKTYTSLERSSQASHSEPEYYNLRSRDVQKVDINNKQVSEDSSPSQYKSEYITQELDRQNTSEKSRNTKSFESFNSQESSVSNSNFEKLKQKMHYKLEKIYKQELNKDESSQKSESKVVIDVQKKKKRKRVIVLLETIECKLCVNDIQKEIFVKLLDNRSYMI